MKNKGSNGIIVLLSILLIIAVYYEIGICRDAIHEARDAEYIKNQETLPEVSGEQGEMLFETGNWDMIDNFESGAVTVEGRIQSEDYPYGYNAGTIEDEAVGKAVLLTPGTSLRISGRVPENAELMVSFKIHPWVAADSDGAMINFEVKTDENAELFSYEVSEQESMETIDFERFANQNITLSVYLSNKDGCGEECDWAVLQTFTFQTEN